LRVAFCLVRYPVCKGLVRLMANYSLYARSAALLHLGMVVCGRSKKRTLRAALGGSLCLPGLKFRVKRRFRPILCGLALSAGLPTALFYLDRLFLNLNFLTFNKA
jgi:hypothetical protein